MRLIPLLVLGASLLLAAQSAISMEETTRQRLSQALEVGDEEAVQTLPKTDKAVLQATLALEESHPDKALVYLQGLDASSDPLISLLEAEAYRRSAVLAVDRAGDYADVLKPQRAQLAEADLTAGLGEAQARLTALADKLDGSNGFPVDLLQLGTRVHNVFLVDKARSRLFIFERQADGSLQRVADEYVVTGEKAGDKQKSGDGRTPNGIYRFVKRLEGSGLEERYGPVAFPIDYPNELDNLHHKNGHGIWMHGFADGVNRRPPRDTKGCFALPNPRLVAISEHVKLGQSWVLVGSKFRFDKPEEQQQLKASVSSAIEQWRKDWASLDTEAYLTHYHQGFRSGKRDLKAWQRYKRRVNSHKAFIDVQLSDMTLIHDASSWPEGEIVMAEFNQVYRSDNYQDETRKRLYLARQSADQPWQILIEETL